MIHPGEIEFTRTLPARLTASECVSAAMPPANALRNIYDLVGAASGGPLLVIRKPPLSGGLGCYSIVIDGILSM